MNILVFDFFADYGHYKIPYTITSPQTFSIPTKTSLYGLIGAITGLDKSNYLSYFQTDSCLISVSVKNKIIKTYISENLINTKNVEMFARMNSKKISPRTQIKFEFLKNPRYRIYVYLNDYNLFKQLKENLENHITKYSISMGLSELLANFEYIGCYNCEPIENNDNYIEINSVIPLDLINSINDIKFTQKECKFIKQSIPVQLDTKRELTQIKDFLIESNALTITAKIKKYYHIKELNENIVLF